MVDKNRNDTGKSRKGCMFQQWNEVKSLDASTQTIAITGEADHIAQAIDVPSMPALKKYGMLL